MDFPASKFTAFVGAFLLATSTSTLADEYSDARTILDARSGTVLKWAKPPKIVLVKDHLVDVDSLPKLLEKLADVTTLSLPDFFVEKVNADTDLENFYTETRLEIRRIDGEAVFELTLGLAEPSTVVGNFFVFVLPYEMAAHVMALTGFGRQNAALNRQYFAKHGACFFTLSSKNGRILIARVFVQPDLSSEELEACIYEEVTQAFGLPNDANGSEFFTYDNLNDRKPRTRDMRLLGALYKANVKPGDSVDLVIENYRESSEK
jgi:hypothetical protein